MALIILFGTTGAGKTFIGKLLEKEFGYYFYDGDTDLTEEVKTALHSLMPITDAMRNRFINHLIAAIVKLTRKYPNLAVAQTFIKEKDRQKLLKKLPQAKFILVEAKTERRYKRRRARADYPWDETYVKKIDSSFETPEIPYQTISNDNDGIDKLKADLQRLV
jgi:gluconate kinase